MDIGCSLVCMLEWNQKLANFTPTFVQLSILCEICKFDFSYSCVPFLCPVFSFVYECVCVCACGPCVRLNKMHVFVSILKNWRSRKSFVVCWNENVVMLISASIFAVCCSVAVTFADSWWWCCALFTIQKLSQREFEFPFYYSMLYTMCTLILAIAIHSLHVLRVRIF